MRLALSLLVAAGCASQAPAPAPTVCPEPEAPATVPPPAGVEPPPPAPPPEPPPPRLVLEPTTFAELDGWADDDLDGALPAFLRTCDVFEKRKDESPVGPGGTGGTIADWRPVCQAARKTPPDGARAFFETWFVPYRASNNGDPVGGFTGYYEATIRASRKKGGKYRWPVHRRPRDLVMVHLQDFRDDPSPRRVAGRVVGGRLRPYETRAEIRAGALDGKGLELFWADDPIDVFFAQIQGSARVELPGGKLARVGYDGWNGHPYTAIGRVLVAEGAIPKETLSMQTIRQWLVENPDRADEIMNANQAYAFFRLEKKPGAVGSLGVVVTAERSMAVDPFFIPLGAPLFVQTEVPVPGSADLAPWRRLVLAQDTGGAIRGPVRGDIFWGAGDRAYEIAGRLRSRGTYALLLPRTVSVASPAPPDTTRSTETRDAP